MVRYLVYFSYLGTKYRGLAKQPESTKLAAKKPFKTIQECIEKSLVHLNSAIESPRISLSSRTDAGVHALCNTFHVDLTHKDTSKEYDALVISKVMNKEFLRKEEDIRVLKVLKVSDGFHSRHCAKYRTYMYRLGVHRVQPDHTLLPNGMNPEILELYRRLPIPIIDHHYASVVRRPFREDLILPATEVLRGLHDFSAFTTESGRAAGKDPNKDLSIQIKKNLSFLYEHQSAMIPPMDIYEFEFTARSFLYRMIRRLIGSIVMVCKEHMTLDTLSEMLKEPKKYFSNGPVTASPGGLFLKHVAYDDRDLEQYAVITASQKRMPLTLEAAMKEYLKEEDANK